jgi:hypothetical protein
MKRFYIGIVIGVLLLSGISFTTGATETKKNVSVQLTFSDLQIMEQSDSAMITLQGTTTQIMIPYHYMVPSLQKTFTFPFGTTITSIQCTPGGLHKEQLSSKLDVSPTPRPMVPTQNDKEDTSVIPMVIDSWYDYERGTGIVDGVLSTILKITVYPVRYAPSTDTIEWTSTMDLEINYQEPPQSLQTTETYSFLIITPSSYADDLEPLVTHKNTRDVTTKLVTLDDIYDGVYFTPQGRDDQEKIKYFIKNAIETWGTSSVMLVGGAQTMPTRTTHIQATSDDNEVFVSDLYYADIYNETGVFSSWDTNNNDVFAEYNWGSSKLTDDLDLNPDVYLGRLACVDEAEVATVVSKIIQYETTEAYTADWFTNLLVMGGDSFPGDKSQVDEGEKVNEKVIQIMDGFIPEKVWMSNGKLEGISPSGASAITDAINQGCGFVDFSGHGNTHVWATHPHENDKVWLPTPLGGYYNTNINDLENGDKLPIVITGACSVGKFNKDEDCFAWSFIAAPDGGGIASCGATALGYAMPGNYITQGLVEKMAINMFTAYKEGAITFGEMWQKALFSYISPRMDGTDYKTVLEWEAFGDPTLAIGENSLAPSKPSAPEGPTTAGIRKEQTYTTSTTDPDGDELFYLFEWGDGEYSGWVGPYGSGETAQASHQWQKKGDYEIRVKAKDDHGVQSDWSDPLPVTLTKTRGFSLQILADFFSHMPSLFQLLRTLFP